MLTARCGPVRTPKPGKNYEGWLAARGDSPADYRWLCDRLNTWHDKRYPNRLAEEHVEKLLAIEARRSGARCRRASASPGPEFPSQDCGCHLRIATLAAQGGGARSAARILLSDFAERFKEDPSLAAAEALARQLAD